MSEIGIAVLAEQHLDELAAEILECQEVVESLRAEIGNARSALQAALHRSQSFRQSADQRLEALGQKAAAIRDALRTELASATDDVAEAVSESEALAVLHESRVEETDEHLAQLNAGVKHIEEALSSAVDGLTQNTHAVADKFHQLNTQAGERMESTLSTTHAALAEHTEHQADHMRSQATQLEETSHAVLADFSAGDIQTHLQSASASIAQMSVTLEQIASQLGGAVGQAVSSFGNVHDQEIARLASEIKDTDRSITRAVHEFAQTVGNFATVSAEVTQAMEDTQVGLKVVVGSLEKAKHLLEEIETL